MAGQRTASRGACAVHRAMAVAAAVAVLGLCWGGVGVASAQRTADEAPMELIVPLDSPGELWARGFTGTRCLQYTVVSLSANRSFTAIFQTKTDFDTFQAAQFRGSYLALDGASCTLTAECSRRVEGLELADTYMLSLHNPNPGNTVQQFAVSLSVVLSDCTDEYEAANAQALREAQSNHVPAARRFSTLAAAALLVVGAFGLA